jgi:hypothetical protein
MLRYGLKVRSSNQLSYQPSLRNSLGDHPVCASVVHARVRYSIGVRS